MDDLLRVAEYTIDRGRTFELDRCDTGRATVTIHDTEGLLDPTNAVDDLGIQPLLQARLALWNPVLEDWYTRYRGFVEAVESDFHPSQLVNTITISLVDIFEFLSIEMHPGHFGTTPPAASKGNVYYDETPDDDEHGMQLRVNQILEDANIPDEFKVVFSGNVSLKATVYSPGESAMAAIQDAVDAEFPAVGNVYGDRLGRLAVHGRYARFDPLGTEAITTGWDFHDWKAGDGAAVAASPTDTAHIRGFSMSRDVGKVINRASASPLGIADDDIAGQVVQDASSISNWGIRPWSSENLIIKQGVTESNTALEECRLYAQYFVDEYASVADRISSVTFRSQRVGAVGDAANWLLLSECDLGDRVAITIGSPGGGGFSADQFFVEGVHEIYRPAGPELDDVTLTLDLSPASYFDDNPFSPL